MTPGLLPHPPGEPHDSGAPQDAPEPRYLVIAEIVRPHGVRGVVRCKIVTEHPEHFDTLERVYVGDPPVPYRVRRTHIEGDRNASTVLLTLAGINSREQAEHLRGALVCVPAEEAIPLEPGQYYAHEVIGLDVVSDAGEKLGRVSDIITTGANDVYVVLGPRGEVLLPAISSVVKEIDVEGGIMRVHLIDGLV